MQQGFIAREDPIQPAPLLTRQLEDHALWAITAQKARLYRSVAVQARITQTKEKLSASHVWRDITALRALLVM